MQAGVETWKTLQSMKLISEMVMHFSQSLMDMEVVPSLCRFLSGQVRRKGFHRAAKE